MPLNVPGPISTKSGLVESGFLVPLIQVFRLVTVSKQFLRVAPDSVQLFRSFTTGAPVSMIGVNAADAANVRHPSTAPRNKTMGIFILNDFMMAMYYCNV